ncbi:MAG: WcaI family glycosyltransferase [Pseudomonadales bacterium]|nr:WcaI family glycosyltransferase [Pseudomonadales bacterium]
MRFVLYSINYSPELTGIGKYNGELAESLSARGIDTHVITAPPYYPEWEIHKGYRNRWSKQADKDVLIYRCPLYVPQKITLVRRLIHLSSFALSSAFRSVSLLRLKPDVLFVVQPTLFCTPAALLYCKLTGAKSVMHIQDYEIDAMFGLGMMQRGFLVSTIKRVESWLMARFDLISTISHSMLENAKAKGVDTRKLLLFPNWADIDFVTPDIDGSSLKEEWGFSTEDKIVLYAGNMGEKQGLEAVLEAAEQLQNNAQLHFVMVGAGAHAETLAAIAVERNLTNVHFKPLQPWERVPEMLVMADLHLIIQKCGAADAVLPSKLTNILSAGGHAIVTAEQDTELGILAEKYPGIYERIEPENTEQLVLSLNDMLNRNLDKRNKIARDYAVGYLSKDKILDRFEHDMKKLCSTI